VKGRDIGKVREGDKRNGKELKGEYGVYF